MSHFSLVYLYHGQICVRWKKAFDAWCQLADIKHGFSFGVRQTVIYCATSEAMIALQDCVGKYFSLTVISCYRMLKRFKSGLTDVGMKSHNMASPMATSKKPLKLQGEFRIKDCTFYWIFFSITVKQKSKGCGYFLKKRLCCVK